MPKTLLLADDSVTIQKVVGITFANEDVELVTVDNGDDALVRARQLKPDLVLADIGMPGLNGYELCGAIRRDPQLGHIPVLLLTGTFETYDEEKAREVGANGHISKPFEAQALVDRVFALLAQAAAPAPRPAAPAPAPAARPTVAAAPTPTPRPAVPQAQAPRPAAPPVAAPVAPPVAAPAAQPQAPRPRPELPPMPGTSAARPAQRPAGAPAPTPRPSAPFEFDLPGEPAAATAPPAHPAPPTPPLAPAAPAEAHTPVGEAMWEAEPELEAVDAIDETPMRREEAAPDATRLFAPDLLGRPARLPEPPPEVPEPPPAPRGARGDFSFGDLDFEEPTGPANPHQSQIFGDSFGSANEPAVLADPLDVEPVAIEPIAVEPTEAEALADPLYSQTRFLDPHAPAPAPHFDTPNPAAAPPLPDLLAGEEITQPAESEEEPEELAEADLEPEPLDDEDPFAKPFSPETAAALSAPEFQPHETPRALAATRLMMDEPALPSPVEPPEDMPAAKPLPLAEVDTAPSLAPVHVPAPPAAATVSTAVTLPPRESRPAAEPARAAVAQMIDSTQLAQVVEKVAWEAFGALSEQVVGEVMKRVEAVVWEVVPQLCERLIQEEIARLKAELPE